MALLFPNTVSSSLVKVAPPAARLLSSRTQCLLLTHHQHHKIPISISRSLSPLSVIVKKDAAGGLTRRRGGNVICASAYLQPETVKWVCSVSAAVLMLARSTAIQKTFLVPLLTLQAPNAVVSWIKGEYGAWTAFLALFVRLFFQIPGQLELPLTGMLLTMVAPRQAEGLRGTQPGTILSLLIAAYLTYQHFSRVGSPERAFDGGAIVPTLGIVSLVGTLCFSLLQR